MSKCIPLTEAELVAVDIAFAERVWFQHGYDGRMSTFDKLFCHALVGAREGEVGSIPAHGLRILHPEDEHNFAGTCHGCSGRGWVEVREDAEACEDRMKEMGFQTVEPSLTEKPYEVL